MGEGGEDNTDTTFNAVDDETKIDCQCVDPKSDCYKDHYAGKCGCYCSDCDCKCVLLVRLDRIGDTDDWSTDHSVRRFIRPVLIRDLQPEEDKKQTQPAPATGTGTAQGAGGGEAPKAGKSAKKRSAKASTIARALGSS